MGFNPGGTNKLLQFKLRGIVLITSVTEIFENVIYETTLFNIVICNNLHEYTKHYDTINNIGDSIQSKLLTVPVFISPVKALTKYSNLLYTYHKVLLTLPRYFTINSASTDFTTNRICSRITSCVCKSDQYVFIRATW